MTCILALENGKGDDYVMVSKNAAAQPEVKLGLKEGEQYYLEDLLYSLMLKSHNDTAVAIAEHIGGSVEGFAHMMNEKAKEIGCTSTHFVTSNGLDGADAGGVHETTARDLALIMSYAIKNKTFLHITQTRDYSFYDLSGNRQFSVHNANAFLDMTPDAISGKTGFTGNAGYCYVGACKNEGRTFIIALLGCGWPNNKSYKWKDTMKLLEYGKENFHKEVYWQEPAIPEIQVKDGEFIFDPEQDIVKVAVVERHKMTGNVACGFLKGYGIKEGAVALSVAHDSHNIIVVGVSDEEMAFAVEALQKQSGGVVLVKDGEVIESMPMPIAGLMSDQSAEWVDGKLTALHEKAYDILGVNGDVEPVMTLCFMSLAVIPELKLTDEGLFDVTKFAFINVEC